MVYCHLYTVLKKDCAWWNWFVICYRKGAYYDYFKAEISLLQ